MTTDVVNRARPIRTLAHAYRSWKTETWRAPSWRFDGRRIDEQRYIDLVEEAIASGCDAFALDLEDFVEPSKYKPQARHFVRQMIEEYGGRGHLIFVRVNAASNLVEIAADLEAIVCPQLHGIQLPKPRLEDIPTVSLLLELQERRAGMTVGHTLIQTLPETAEYYQHAFEVAKASPRVTYLGGGTHPGGGDPAVSFSWRWRAAWEETLYARSRIVMAGRAAGTPYVIGGMITDGYEDLATARAYTIQNRDLGYTGMNCYPIPELVQMINEVFTPDRDEIENWRVLDAELAKNEAEGVLHIPNPGSYARHWLAHAQELDLMIQERARAAALTAAPR
jgi:citrate lyase subunit beta/citryl-CoA lyase